VSEHATRARGQRLDEQVEWLHRCHDEEREALHLHLSQYLLDTADGTVLVDAGGAHSEALVDALRERIDDLDAVLLTHAILPHTGGLATIREEWPDVTVVSTSAIPPAVGVEDAEPAFINDTAEIAGDTFTFIDPLLTDVVVSTWIYHHESGSLFTAEGVGHYHAPGECARRSVDYPDGIPEDHVHAFAADKLRFLEYVDPEKLAIAFDTLRAEYDVERFAPIHGNPVEGEDVPAYVETLVDVAGRF